MPRKSALIRREFPVAGGIRVIICDPAHPHAHETGELTGELIRFRFSGEQMAKVKLDACRHGVDACYVAKGQVRGLTGESRS